MLQSKRRGPGKAPRPTSKRRPNGHATHAVDYAALAQFRYQLRKFLSFSKEAARKAGLTPQQHQALLAVKGFSRPGPISVGDLAEFLFVRHHSAVELVDRMAKLALLARAVDDTDSRRILLKITKKGEKKLQAISRMNFEELRTASPTLTGLLRSFRRSQDS
jgi:DNA-binding MarR family transcriptional regulator